MNKVKLRQRFNSVFKLLTIVFTIGGFFWLCLGQMEKYFSGKTTATVFWDNVETYEAPVFIFCNKVAFKQHVQSALMPKHEFDQLAHDINVTFQAYFSGTEMLEDILIEKFIYTMYNGKCKEFQLQQNIKPRNYLTFYVDGEIDLFLVFPGEEIYIIDQSWDKDSLTFTSITETSQTIIYDLFEEKHIRIKGCKADITSHDVIKCLKKRINEMFNEKQVKCLYPQLKPYSIQEPELPDCKNETDMNDIQLAISMIFHNDHMKHLCPRPCETRKLDIRKTLGSYKSGLTNSTEIFMTYPSNQVITYQEYYIYDLNSIVASVGGGLGLFLGFSCLNAVSKAIDWFTK